MADVPDDLSSVGTHHGNEPPTETGQEVRSPDGPDPSTKPATPAQALFQIVRLSAEDYLQIRVHSPRAEVSPPNDEDMEEVGQYRSVDALRDALADLPIDGRTAIFEDATANTVLTEKDVSPDHDWIGQPRYERITFVADDDAADNYVSTLDRSSA
jgi:hypothetical protein